MKMRLLMKATVLLAIEFMVLLSPRRAEARARLICGGPICVDQCTQSNSLCDYLTSGECPHFDSCTYEPTCDILTGGIAITCT